MLAMSFLTQVSLMFGMFFGAVMACAYLVGFLMFRIMRDNPKVAQTGTRWLVAYLKRRYFGL
jgi:hypothetical protein